MAYHLTSLDVDIGIKMFQTTGPSYEYLVDPPPSIVTFQSSPKISSTIESLFWRCKIVNLYGASRAGIWSPDNIYWKGDLFTVG